MDDTICDYSGRMKEMSELHPDVQFPQSILGFYSGIEPVDYALSCIAQLEESGEYEIWIATAPSVKNLHCYSEKAEWICNYLGEEYLSRLIIVPDKSKLIGDYLIDDICVGKGQDKFTGELIQYKTTKWPTWIDVTSYLLSK